MQAVHTPTTQQNQQQQQQHDQTQVSAITDPTIVATCTTVPICDTSVTNTGDALTARLQNYLLFTLVLLDKLHNRSSLSLLLIHLRNVIDDAIDEYAKNGTNSKSDFTTVTQQFDHVLETIFTYSARMNLCELKQVYNDYRGVIDHPSADLINCLLCCSESLVDYRHFNGVFNKESIIAHDLEKSHTHFQSSCFKNDTSCDGINVVDSTYINPENLKTVVSPEFTTFHVNRLQALGLFDKHIFKYAKLG